MAAFTVTETTLQSHMEGRPLAVRRIAKFLFNRYGKLVDMRDYTTKGEEDSHNCMLSRSLAAHAVSVYAKLDPEDSVSCLVDGGQDLGIDAIAVDEREKRCWVFQSKFQHSGQGLMKWAEMLKFLEGFNALTSEKLEGANPKILSFESEIRRAATEPGWKYSVVLASTSVMPLAEASVLDVQTKMAYEDPGNSGTFSFEQFTLNRITTSIEQSLEAASITLSIELHNWGCVTNPYMAYYGQVSLDAVAKWREHGPVLFAKNLRGFMHSTEVSESIAKTLDSQSELFWYLNNGATILCERIVRSGPYSQQASRERGHFECIGASVVNGAQTVGTVWEQPGNGEGLDPRGTVHLRIISLESASSDFAQLVTKATNTQRNILARDFATLDAAQRRLAREFSLEGKQYVFRQGDPLPSKDKGCDIEELSIALACNTSVELATIAYRNAGFLIDPDNQFYRLIFGVSGKP